MPINSDINTAVEWIISDTPVDYQQAVTRMETRVADILRGHAPELIWLLEHPALYTAGTSARSEDLLTPDRFPVHKTGRGGQYTYHGPGQRVVYVMLDLKRFNGDVRAYVFTLEDWVIDTLAQFNIKGERRQGRIGIWVARPDKRPGRDDKIAALGIRVRKWISYHGLAINLDPDLDHFSGITPCGISDHGTTSLTDLGIPAMMSDLDIALRESFERIFSSPTNAAPSNLAETASKRR